MFPKLALRPEPSSSSQAVALWNTSDIIDLDA